MNINLIELTQVIALPLIGVALYLINRKIKRIDKATWNIKQFVEQKFGAAEINLGAAEINLYRQLESLGNLNALIKLPKPLTPLRGWAGSPDFLLKLARIVTSKKPQTIVECSSGSSTIVVARCCQLNNSGHVFSLEHELEFAEQTRIQLIESGLQEWATVIHAPLQPTTILNKTYPWYALNDLPELAIDLLVIDGPPGGLVDQARYPAGPLLIPRLASGGIIILDDAGRDDEILILDRWKSEFSDLKIEYSTAEKGLAILEKNHTT